MAKRLRDKSDGWKDVVGQPDEWDRQNLEVLINQFIKAQFKECEIFDMECDEKTCKHPRNISGKRWIDLALASTRRDHQLEAHSITTNPFGLKNKDSDSRIVTSMPELLHHIISDTMPTIFRDKGHFEWFLKHFKHYFMVPSKY